MGTCASKGSKYPQLNDRDWLVEHYVTKDLSTAEVAALIGCHGGSVCNALRRHGIQIRGRHHRRWNDKECERCGTRFTPSGPAARFCTPRCRAGQQECPACHQLFDMPERIGQQRPSHQKYCSEECRSWAISQSLMARHDRRRKFGPPGRDLSSQGYVRLYYGAPGNGGYRVMEHRQVMEDHLGRPLLKSETVHHINGDRADNRIENLQVRQGRHGKGVVYRCNSCGSHDVDAVEIDQR